jgi:hypothetical protein|tara:strand:- start:85 stop:261 length:177 start_codon:yes stop_codon:yes gene_type:complete
MTKEKATLEMVISWLNDNIDDNEKLKNELFFDSYELKEKIEIALEPETTIEQIENGDL